MAARTVQWIAYDFVVDSSRHDYSAAPPWEGTLGDFDCRLEAGRLTARPMYVLDTEEAARASLEPYLRAWELRSELQDGIPIEFRFASSHVVEEGAGDGTHHQLSVSDHITFTDSVETRVGLLTRLEAEYGGRKHAARALNVSERVLSTLGRLAAKNDPVEGRKAKGPLSPLTEVERQWLFAAVPRLVLQAAEVAAGSQPPFLDMGNLPAL